MRPERWVYKLPLRIRSLFDRRKADQELDEELQYHVEQKTQQHITAGLNPQEARRAVLLEMGGLERRKEECRDARQVTWLQDLLQDIHYGLCILRKSPGFTTIAILTLALGIGANTIIFSVVNAVMYRKPPMPEPDRVMVVSSASAVDSSNPDRVFSQLPASGPDYLDWRAQTSSFSEMAVADFDSFTISGDAIPERASGARVSPEFFNVLGVAPAFGRAILPGEDQPGHDQEVILSDELWRSKFGGDAHVLGRLIKINGNWCTVIGVMPPSFRAGSFIAKLWVPLVLPHAKLGATGRDDRSFRVFARLKPGINVRQASAEMATIAQRLGQAHPETNRGWGAGVMSLQQFSIADMNAGPPLAFLMSAVAFLLLIACANIANLLLARNSARQREFTVRGVLGAGRLRLARQLLTECLMLSFTGGILGILVGYGGLHAVLPQFNWNEDAVVLAKQVTIDDHVLGVTLAIIVVCSIMFGLAPALQFSRGDASHGLKEGGRGTTISRERHRVQRLLVAGQLALSLFLLVGASMFAGQFIQEMRANPGLNPRNMLTASISLRGPEYLQPQRQKSFYENALRRLAGSPGVQSAAVTSDMPFNFPDSLPFTVENHLVTKPGEQPACGHFAVSPGFFATTQIPLLQGREFTAADTADSPPVAIVNEAFARRYFPGENPIGRYIRIDPAHRSSEKWSEIIGVAGNVNEYLGQAQPRSAMFESFLARPRDSMYLMVRTRTDPAQFSDALRRAVWAEDGNQAVTDLRTMERVIADSSGGDDLLAELMGAFAATALLIAAIGIYGVLSYLVGQRTHEMGIRMALGATPGELLLLVIRNGMTLVVTGAAIGFLVSLSLPKLIAAGFNDFRFHGAWVIGLAPFVVIVVGLVACYIPARRAMKVDPMVALRYE
jgi:putative ABC transport system permease protein